MQHVWRRRRGCCVSVANVFWMISVIVRRGAESATTTAGAESVGGTRHRKARVRERMLERRAVQDARWRLPKRGEATKRNARAWGDTCRQMCLGGVASQGTAAEKACIRGAWPVPSVRRCMGHLRRVWAVLLSFVRALTPGGPAAVRLALGKLRELHSAARIVRASHRDAAEESAGWIFLQPARFASC